MFAYSSGNGASYHVSMSYSPKRIRRMRNPLGGCCICGMGVDREGDSDRSDAGGAVASERR